MKPFLATNNGANVAAVYNGPRFASRGGSLHDYAQAGARPTLAEAREAFDLLRHRIATEQSLDIRCLLAREALSLAEAIVACCEQRRAAGWRIPEDADRARA